MLKYIFNQTQTSNRVVSAIRSRLIAFVRQGKYCRSVGRRDLTCFDMYIMAFYCGKIGVGIAEVIIRVS